MTQCWHPIPDDRPNFSTILERIGYCLQVRVFDDVLNMLFMSGFASQDPDVVGAPLPVFHRPPSTERDTTLMRPPAHDTTLLHLQKGPGGEFLLPMDSVEMHASPSGGSAEHLLGEHFFKFELYNNLLFYRRYRFQFKLYRKSPATLCFSN
jgi:hypothetical protein